MAALCGLAQCIGRDDAARLDVRARLRQFLRVCRAVQYAHARICRILENWGGDENTVAGVDLSPLTAPTEATLLATLAAYPEMLARAQAELSPHQVAFYLRELASNLHSFYFAEKVLVEDEAIKRARLALVVATRQVLRNGLKVLGVSAPQKM